MTNNQNAPQDGTPGGGNGNGGHTGSACAGDQRITDLLVSSFESSVRTAYCMVRIPVVCYANLLENWCQAIEAATRQCEGGNGGGGNGGGNGGGGGGPGPGYEIELPDPITEGPLAER